VTRDLPAALRAAGLTALARALAATSLAVLVLSLVFVTLHSLVGKLEGVTRDTPVIWEWLLYLASMVWLALHAVVLGRRRP
jgi:hypothetical protein